MTIAIDIEPWAAGRERPAVHPGRLVGRAVIVRTHRGDRWRTPAVAKTVSPAWLRKLARDGVDAVEVDDGAGCAMFTVAELLGR